MKGMHQGLRRWRVAAMGVATLLMMGLASAPALADQPIVGLWEVTLSLTGMPPLHSFENWNSDHTQLENAAKPILGGNVCLGAWISLGKNSFGLTHPVYLFDDTAESSTEGQPTGNSGNLLYSITVDSSKANFSGNATLKLYKGFDPFDPAAPVLATFKGTVVGKRVSVDKSQLP